MKSAEDFKVDNEQLPGLVNDGRFRKEQYAGHIIVDPINDGQLFFWFLNRMYMTSSTNVKLI
jgi:hypothetical protein